MTDTSAFKPTPFTIIDYGSGVAPCVGVVGVGSVGVVVCVFILVRQRGTQMDRVAIGDRC